MKNLFKFFLLLIFCSNSFSCETKYFKDISSVKGVNFGGALDDVRPVRWKNYPKISDIDTIKNIGFNTIRIPVNWALHSDKNGNIDQEFLDRVDDVVQNIICSGLYVIINVHGFNEIYDDVNSNKEKLKNIWFNLARHYKKYPNSVLYEIINEPRKNLSGSANEIVLKEVYDIIRREDFDKYIVFSGDDWGNISGLLKTHFPCDKKSIISFHYYEPFKFTHQGVWWIKEAVNWMGTGWPKSYYEKEKLIKDFEIVRGFGDKNCSSGFVVGEFGVYDKAPSVDRRNWIRGVRVSSENSGFGWIYWNYMFDFKIFDENLGVDKEMVEALFN